MKANYHTHLSLCGHAVGMSEDYVKVAIEAGYEELGMSDHGPIKPEFMTKEEFRTNNRLTMIDTYQLCKINEILSESIKNTIKNTKVVYEKDNVCCEANGPVKKMFVSPKRTYEAASYYKNKKVTILNFANNHSIGGAPYSAGAQEESLCRCSTLLPCLEAQEETFYIPHRNDFENGVLGYYGNEEDVLRLNEQARFKYKMINKRVTSFGEDNEPLIKEVYKK